MATQCDWDIVIAGAGLAGLAMACELAHAHFAHLRVAVVDPRSTYVRDRTWSYWRTRAHPYAHLERKSWNAWSLRHAGKEVVCRSELAYCSIDADVFYNHARKTIADCKHIELLSGHNVAGVEPGWPARVTLASGQVLTAGLALDARGPRQGDAPALAQHFAGWEVRTERDVFDDQCVRLMDFVPVPATQGAGVHFFYVLPYGPRQALVESTWVSPAGLGVDYDAEIKAYLRTQYGVDRYEVLYREQGSLGLTLARPAPAQPGVLSLGRAAGALRASTGYAFLETVAHCAQVAHGIARSAGSGGGLRAQPVVPHWQAFRRHAADAWMDGVFLQALQTHWARAPDYFMAMFERTAADAVARFMSGQATVADRVRLAASLPPSDFLRAALPGGARSSAGLELQ